MRQLVRNYPDLIKVDQSYIVNENTAQYNSALARIKTTKKIQSVEDRLTQLENNISKILNLLEGR